MKHPTSTLDFFVLEGQWLSNTILVISLGYLLAILRFNWTCGLCGKQNSGNFFQYILQWCDHGGDFN